MPASLCLHIFMVLSLGLVTDVSSSDSLTSWLTSVETSKPNVLFLVADDLRPWLGCYGEPFMHTPNIDKLAAGSVRFDSAYVQHGVCSPSRASFMTGRRSDTTRVLDLHTNWRTSGGNFTTVSQYFKEQGYKAEGIGKIFHSGSSSGGTDDFPFSWSTKPDRGYNGAMKVPDRKASSVRPIVQEEGDLPLQDENIADIAISRIQGYAANPEEPFFLAVGFKKPHLPFTFPEQYQDLYPESSMSLAEHREIPPDLARLAWITFGELRSYNDIQNLNLTPPYYAVPDAYQMVLRKGYAATVSYIDAQVKRVLSALTAEGFANNTVIAFLSDHGFQLGENGQWCKHNNFETTVRVPLLLHVPGVTDKVASCPTPSTRKPVELVDLFPTLTQLAGLPVPSTCPEDSSLVATCVEGTSLVPLVREATGGAAADAPWKDVAFSQFPRHLKSLPKMGYTMRSQHYRYTEWVGYNLTTYRPDYSTMYERELYVHYNSSTGLDPDPEEHFNMAEEPQYAGVVEKLSGLLRAGWRGALERYHDQLTP